MFKNSGFKIITISCVTVFTVTFCMASIGYCGGGFGGGTTKKLIGPSLVGYIIVKEDLKQGDGPGIIVEFHGKCAGENVDIEDFHIHCENWNNCLPTDPVPTVPDSEDQLKGFRVPHGQLIPGNLCLPANGGNGDDDLVVRAVSDFHIIEPAVCVSAFVVLGWSITPD